MTVYLLMIVHVVHWKLAGRTLAPLELNELMYTLELGIITAGFLFMVLAAVGTAVFGRFFCSWGCHILALEDLAAWLLGKLHIRPKPVRSRLLRLVPLGALLYMFAWPQVVRIAEGRPAPTLHMRTDVEGWASFMTENFWRNLPDPGIMLLTFFLCGFAIVYMLGSRAFCTYGCPYGVLFGLADRIAPGRIVTTGDCKQCGRCTAVCSSHVRVHEEIAAFGKIVNPGCLKDLDCVAVCPNEALRYGLARPPLFDRMAVLWRKCLGRSATGATPVRPEWAAKGFIPHGNAKAVRIVYDFSLAEDALMAVVFVASLLIFRGLYGVVPFLMTLGIGAIAAYGAVLCVRLARRPYVRLNNFQLKLAGQVLPAGRAFVAVSSLLGLFTLHSAFIRYHEYLGERAYLRSEHQPSPDVVAAATSHLDWCDRLGLFARPDLPRRLAALHLRGGSPAAAEPYVLRLLEREPDNVGLRFDLIRVQIARERFADAGAQLDRVRDVLPALTHNATDARQLRAMYHELAAAVDAGLRRADDAAANYRVALAEQPDAIARARIHAALGELLANGGDAAGAIEQLRWSLALQPDAAPVHYNLAVVLSHGERDEEAVAEYARTLELNPSDAEAHNNLGFVLARRGDLDAAGTHFRRAIALRADYAHPHYCLGRLLDRQGKGDEARGEYAIAARLDKRYAGTREPGIPSMEKTNVPVP